MLSEIMATIHNYFEVEGGAHTSVWAIEGGTISLPFLAQNQYFKITGSVFNDGVYKYTDQLELTDETFNGEIKELAIPSDFLALAEEIEQWQSKNAESVSSVFTSESFGGYSYSKATTQNGETYTWQSAFAPRLRRWRKL